MLKRLSETPDAIYIVRLSDLVYSSFLTGAGEILRKEVRNESQKTEEKHPGSPTKKRRQFGRPERRTAPSKNSSTATQANSNSPPPRSGSKRKTRSNPYQPPPSIPIAPCTSPTNTLYNDSRSFSQWSLKTPSLLTAWQTPQGQEQYTYSHRRGMHLRPSLAATQQRLSYCSSQRNTAPSNGPYPAHPAHLVHPVRADSPGRVWQISSGADTPLWRPGLP